MTHRKSKPSDPMTKYGRPIAYDREIFIAICRRLIIGEDLEKICTERGMPIEPVFLGWIQDHKEAREIYRSADNFYSDRRLVKELLARRRSFMMRGRPQRSVHRIQGLVDLVLANSTRRSRRRMQARSPL